MRSQFIYIYIYISLTRNAKRRTPQAPHRHCFRPAVRFAIFYQGFRHLPKGPRARRVDVVKPSRMKKASRCFQEVAKQCCSLLGGCRMRWRLVGTGLPLCVLGFKIAMQLGPWVFGPLAFFIFSKWVAPSEKEKWFLFLRRETQYGVPSLIL